MCRESAAAKFMSLYSDEEKRILEGYLPESNGADMFPADTAGFRLSAEGVASPLSAKHRLDSDAVVYTASSMRRSYSRYGRVQPFCNCIELVVHATE